MFLGPCPTPHVSNHWQPFGCSAQCASAVAAMAELDKSVKEAMEAGYRMMKLEEKDGVKTFQHPLRFRVSATRLILYFFLVILIKLSHQSMMG